MPRSVKRAYVSAKRQAQARATRTTILDAALRLFSTNGYMAVTIQAVADEAGVAVQTVYAVFGNKRELLRQVLESAVTDDGPPSTPPSAPRSRPSPTNPTHAAERSSTPPSPPRSAAVSLRS